MSSASVWKSKVKVVVPPSLSEIQSEQLVEALSSEGEAVRVVPAVEGKGKEEEGAVALDVDADYAMALALQQQFDKEKFALEQALLQRKVPVDTHVKLDSDMLLEQRRKHTEHFSDDEEGDDDDHEGGERPSGVVAPSVSSPAKVARANHRVADTSSGTKVWKSKHDAEITGQLNTQNLVEEFPDQNFGDLDGELNADPVKLSNPVFNSMMKHAERVQSRGVRNRFGSETQTRDQVIDQKTGLLLTLMINNDHLTKLNGAISTGKESVVFHAVKDEKEFAVKIFKTTLNEFRNRQVYVEGEHRFRHQHKRQNPRRLIRLWAEKEMRNLQRALAVGLRVPEPLLLKKHILVLQFVGKDGHAAPKLRDATLNAESILSAYQQCVALMRRLYQECRLVHCDLSEYNLLWLKGDLWLIDLAQGVDRDHPNALAFLQRDCKSVSDFFRSRGVSALSTRQLFDYVTAASMENPVEVLATQMEQCSATADPNPDEKDAVWYASFIPQSLKDLQDPHHAQSLDKRDRFHDNLIMELGDDELDDDDEDEDDDEDDDDDDDDDEGENGNDGANDGGDDSLVPNTNSSVAPPPPSSSSNKQKPDKSQRKANKKAVKKEQREKRAQRSKLVQDK